MIAGPASAAISFASTAQTLYMSGMLDGHGYIWSVQADGSDAQTLLISDLSPHYRGIDLAPSTGRVYWGGQGFGLYDAPIDDLKSWERVGWTTGELAVDEPRDLLVTLNGTPNSRLTFGTLSDPRGHSVTGFTGLAFALDKKHEHAYFENRQGLATTNIERVGYDGFGRRVVLADVPTAIDMAVDSMHGYVYWASSLGFDGTGGIYRVRLNGSGFETVFVSGMFNQDVHALSLDVERGWAYFAMKQGPEDDAIYRMTLDGRDVTWIAGGFGQVRHMALLVPPPLSAAPLVAVGCIAACTRRRA